MSANLNVERVIKWIAYPDKKTPQPAFSHMDIYFQIAWHLLRCAPQILWLLIGIVQGRILQSDTLRKG